MTPKEKAKTLINNFYNLRGFDWDMALNCSLIAVDEIIKETPQLTPEETFIDGSCGVDFFINERFEYWNEVKNEINKL